MPILPNRTFLYKISYLLIVLTVRQKSIIIDLYILMWKEQLLTHKTAKNLVSVSYCLLLFYL